MRYALLTAYIENLNTPVGGYILKAISTCQMPVSNKRYLYCVDFDGKHYKRGVRVN
jgi:hypothetical protein